MNYRLQTLIFLKRFDSSSKTKIVLNRNEYGHISGSFDVMFLQVFNPVSGLCDKPSNVPGCEGYYPQDELDKITKVNKLWTKWITLLR